MKTNQKKEPSLSHVVPPINLHFLQTRISSFMDMLLKECDHEGIYWVFKQSESNDINVVDLESTEYLESLSEEERIRYIIRLKQLQLDECHRYIHTLRGNHDDWNDEMKDKSGQPPYSDIYNSTSQYLLIQSITILDVCI